MAINGIGKTEANYRTVNLDSSSSLKDFSLDRKKYHRKYILNEDVDDKDTQASVMGKLVETNLMEPDLFDTRFYMSACAAAPTGNMLKFVEALYDRTREATNDNGEVTRSFEDISRIAYIDAGYKIAYERVINSFVGSDAEIYYDEIRKVRSNEMSVVTTQDVTNADKIIEELKTNPITKDIVNLVSDVRYTVQNQLQVEAYKVGGHLFKSMMDKVITDHHERTIQVYDLKCVWAVDNFFEEYYLYRRAYIQAYLYYRAVMSLTLDPNSSIFNYEVLTPKFIVCDSINYFSPLVYTLEWHDLADALLGFEHKGRTYPGVKDMIEDLDWALKNNIWNISRQNYLTNGIVKLRS
jgi:hypothetical protein